MTPLSLLYLHSEIRLWLRNVGASRQHLTSTSNKGHKKLPTPGKRSVQNSSGQCSGKKWIVHHYMSLHQVRSETTHQVETICWSFKVVIKTVKPIAYTSFVRRNRLAWTQKENHGNDLAFFWKEKRISDEFVSVIKSPKMPLISIQGMNAVRLVTFDRCQMFILHSTPETRTSFPLRLLSASTTALTR